MFARRVSVIYLVQLVVLNFTTSALSKEGALETDPNCEPSVTKIRGKHVCRGEVIFEDNFDTIREDLWQIEQYIPADHPEHPFVSYQRLESSPNLFVDNGTLHILPKLQEDLLAPRNESIMWGSLDLTNGCTRRECYKAANGADILPPVVSGRLTSNLAFTYGSVHVRAKLPQGDWLYPEILLEPPFNVYGNHMDLTRILKIAVAGGNRKISEDEFGNEVLRGGPIVNKAIFTDFGFQRRMTYGYWGDDFHNYTLKWTPETIVLSADGHVYLRYNKNELKWAYEFLEPVTPMYKLYNFQDYLHITLGVAAGGMIEFPDGLMTINGKLKPWRNKSSKASLHFWSDHESWYQSWIHPELIVDHVKVVAL